MNSTHAKQPKPPWLKKRLPAGQTYHKMFKFLRECSLHTVCEEAHCPNLGECFSKGTATFMILGDMCTRNCSFCAVGHGRPLPPDEDEPEMVAKAVKELGLRYAVITSVTRDDLPDGGAAHFAETIRCVKEGNPGTRVEVLIPDFKGSESALNVVVEARPDVINHNIETVPSLYPHVRPQAKYERSLQLLKRVGIMDHRIMTKSGLMLGLGEEPAEVIEAMRDLIDAGCRILTLGQYLAPSSAHHRVVRYLPPREFAEWEKKAYQLGFTGVAAGPFVRSSYHAADTFLKAGNG